MSDPNAPSSSSNLLHLVEDNSGWHIQPDLAEPATYSTPSEALLAAEAFLSLWGGQIMVSGKDEEDGLLVVPGAINARRLNGIEGMTPDKRTRRLLRDVAHLPMDQQRKMILAYFQATAVA